MASLNVFFLVVLLGIAGCSADIKFPFFLEEAVNKTSHHLVVGARELGDVSVYQENIAEEYSWTGVLEFTRKVLAPENYVITQVVALDQTTDGTGASVSITAGGPENSFVELRFVSQWWHGVYFKVEVFAKPIRR